MLLFTLLLFVFAFDAGQSKAAFPTRNDSDRIGLDQYLGSDYPHSDGPGFDEPTEVTDDDAPGEAAESFPDQWRPKRWVPPEVSLEQVRQKVLLSRLVNNNARQGKRESWSPLSDGDDGATPILVPSLPASLRRRITNGRRLLTEELEPEANRFVYESETEDGDDVENQRRLPEAKSLMEFAKQERLLRDLIVLSDHLDRQKGRQGTRHPQTRRQKQQGQGHGQGQYQAERLTLNPSIYDLTL